MSSPTCLVSHSYFLSSICNSLLKSSYSYYSCLIVSSAITRFINAKYLLKVPHIHRILTNTLFMGLAFALLALSAYLSQYWFSFYMALMSAIFFGIVTALGESTVLGFCKGFPSSYVGLYSSGTGFAGIFGSGMLLLLKGYGMTIGQIFLVAIPFILLYF